MKKSWVGLAHLMVVWIVWGSTYLAIRYAVREGSGFPPFQMTGSRFLLGGLCLLAWAALRGERLRLSRVELLLILTSSVLLLNGGNGLVTWAEQRAHSGYAALTVGSAPIWSAIIEAVIDRKRPTGLLTVSLLLGFAGLVALTWPVISSGVRADLLATAALVVAPMSWCVGSIIQQRKKVDLAPFAFSGYQQVFSFIGFTLMALATGEPWPTPSAEAWAAWGYLVVFGSIFAFTSYVMALRLLPIQMVMTYAYVNPVIAVFLGWWLLDEAVTGSTLAGTALILLGVAGVFRSRAPARG